MNVIASKAEFDDLVSRINWEDAFIRESYQISGVYLIKGKTDADDRLSPTSIGGNVRVLIALPFEEDAASIEFSIDNVSAFCLCEASELRLACSIDDWAKTIYLTEDKRVWVSGRRISYSLLDETSWGPRLRYGSYPFDPNAIPATPIHGMWRICSNCSEAWEERIDRRFSVCPRCLEMTALIQEGDATKPGSF